MFAWIAQNLGTILISAVLLVIVIAVVRYLIRQKKQAAVHATGYEVTDASSEPYEKKKFSLFKK